MPSMTLWYSRYVGDYQRKTRHLSMLQHGAYTMLLDFYYSNEKPIPIDTMQVHRLCMAFAEDDQAAVEFVLNEFFIETPNGWINKRADEEIENKRLISEKRKKAATKDGAVRMQMHMQVVMQVHMQTMMQKVCHLHLHLHLHLKLIRIYIPPSF